jgi:E3 ubiquitin-protein ligase DOA10
MDPPPPYPSQQSSNEQQFVKECIICLEPVVLHATTVLTCRHAFHTACILRWIEHSRQPLCPVCKQPCIKLSEALEDIEDDEHEDPLPTTVPLDIDDPVSQPIAIQWTQIIAPTSFFLTMVFMFLIFILLLS